jgi:acetate kinase
VKTEPIDNTVINYIHSHNGVTVAEISDGLIKKGFLISLTALRRLMRKLHREKKVIRTGVHTFKYKIRK